MIKKYTPDFLLFLFRRFDQDRCLSHATNLSFTSLLSIVPLMTVSLAILAAFPVFEQLTTQLQDFFFSYFTPKSGSMQGVQKYFLEFSNKATQLTGIGIIFLVVTALMLMYSIDSAFNQIWNVRTKRKAAVGFMVYWAVLTIGPLLMGVSVAVTSYLVSLPLFSKTVANVGGMHWVLSLLPFITTSFAFTLMYMVIPNRSILFRHALIGGVLASIMFELAKKGFAFYVTTFPTYKFIYGALSTIPIFLIWIYISWIVILLGAEITHCISIYRPHRKRILVKNADLFDLLDIIRMLSEKRGDGGQLKTKHLLDALPLMSEYQLVEYLDKLKKSGIVQRTETGAWVLVRDLSDYHFSDLYKAYPCSLPVDNDHSERYELLTNQMLTGLEPVMSLTLKELFEQNSVDN